MHRILNSHDLRPHLSRYFLHVTDPDFFPKAERLIALYQAPPRHLFFFDECPGIQVLKRLTPDLQTEHMSVRLEEFEYVRNGTFDLFSVLNNADGTVYSEYHANHVTETFLGVFERHVRSIQTHEQLHYVMDNLSCHQGYPFCLTVARLSGIPCPPEMELNNQTKRREWLSSESKRIVIHFTPYHGSWLNPVEIWFSILSAKVLKESFDGPESLFSALHAFNSEWNTLLAHPFRWSYDGSGLHEKAVKRFIQMLHTGAATIDFRILSKLLRLMTNLLNQYFKQVSSNTWTSFAKAIDESQDAINALIKGHSKPQAKRKAELAFKGLLKALKDRPELHTKAAA